ELNLPNKGLIKGMGVKEGITLIVGGGYHGKSTILNAIELGVYNHIEGDGREFVITDNTAVKVRAEDGRSIKNTDISLFIDNLPNGKDTVKFTTENASGSTSQAANIVEAIESKTNLLLIDEDT
ncbi:P-loop domain-containing protein, partial [Clostridium perfringens]|uniref:P-loop domain-containing protein n=2 Tax=Clostridium TaxID=1485 RepID=UPI002AC767F1